MHALPERGVWRSFTENELERLGVTEGIMRGFMQVVLRSLCQDEGFYPRQERDDATRL